MTPEQQPDGSWTIHAGAQIDGDGSPRCYGPNNRGLDYTANAGHPGNWWGVKTDNGKTSGNPIVDPGTGLWIADTSLHQNGNPINAETVSFIVVPGHWAMSVPGIVLGCKCEVTDLQTGNKIDAVAADVGPNFGEMSIAAAIEIRELPTSILNDIDALKDLVRRGGISTYRYLYQIWPGVAAPGYTLQKL